MLKHGAWHGINKVVSAVLRRKAAIQQGWLCVACIYLDNEVADADEVEAHGTERMKRAIEFKFRLRISRLTFIP